MADPRDDGGNAFERPRQYAPTYGGMSLRDWFAGMAMQGMLGCSIEVYHTPGVHQLARRAYDHADAMIEAREVKP